jgi:hypothetical protein
VLGLPLGVGRLDRATGEVLRHESEADDDAADDHDEDDDGSDD